MGCDITIWAFINASIMFQSTHPRGVRFANNYYYRTSSDASIHAPAWGATVYVADAWNHCISFNPRTRVGCDMQRGTWLMGADVSIHAPAWGATRHGANVFPGFCMRVSIHAPAWGATRRAKTIPRIKKFQSTHPRGVRHHPRGDFVVGVHVSIHAPAWGATCHYFPPEIRAKFQSTHPRGVRR